MTANLQRGDEILAGLAVENLSMGGAFVRTARPLHEASPVGIVLVAPGRSRPIRLTGRVVSVARDHGAGMGLCFDPYPQEIASALHALLMLHAPGPMVLDGDVPVEAERAPGREAKGPRSSASAARLAVQVKWLLLELSDWRAQASMLQTRNQSLQVEVEQLLAALQRVVR